MSLFIWIEDEVILAIHERQISEHGGLSGLRDRTLLESALAKPKNIAAYDEQKNIYDLAASYAFGISRNHPFLDGNKRTGFVAMELFLSLNGFTLTADDTSCVLVMLDVAAGDISEDDLAAWIKDNSEKS